MANEFEKYLNALRKASLLAQREFSDLWDKLNQDDARATRNVLLVMVPPIIYKYSMMAAEAAAQYFEAERIAFGGNEDFTADIAEPVPLEQIEASVRYAVGHLFGGDEDAIQPEQYGSLFARED